jgi:hypothetical protein
MASRPERGVAADGSSRKAKLVISVTNYRPADDCTPVEIVVNGSKGDGVVHKIGRFGITPATNFDAPDPSQALRFSLPLPEDLRTTEAIELTVRLLLRNEATPPPPPPGPVRVQGTGQGTGWLPARIRATAPSSRSAAPTSADAAS